jgi:hypothetical protein
MLNDEKPKIMPSYISATIPNSQSTILPSLKSPKGMTIHSILSPPSQWAIVAAWILMTQPGKGYVPGTSFRGIISQKTARSSCRCGKWKERKSLTTSQISRRASINALYAPGACRTVLQLYGNLCPWLTFSVSLLWRKWGWTLAGLS